MKKFGFLGTGFEYFKIWIVNILLTIVTLGLYYPWAKVRNNKYFYGNAVLDNRAFDYHATGKQLFFGYVIAFVGVIVYAILEKLAPFLAVILLLVFMVLIPWILLRSIKFDMFVTSFDNVRFKFDGKLSTMYMIVFVLPLLMIVGLSLIGYITSQILFVSELLQSNSYEILISIFLLASLIGAIFYVVFFSYIVVKKNSYYYNNLSYGKSEFKIDLQLNAVIKIVAKVILLGFVFAILNIGILVLVLYSSFDGEFSLELLPFYQLFLLKMIPIMYILFILEFVLMSLYYQVKIREYIYSKLILDDKIKFASTFKVSSFFGVVFTNLLLIIVTLGLAIPWAKVRLARYTLENTQVSSEIDLDVFLSQKQEALSAVGEEIADVTNLEMGFTV